MTPTEPTSGRRAFAVAIYIVRQNRVWLVQHAAYENSWLPVGGEIEPNETPLEAAKRELFEETGLRDGAWPRSYVRCAPRGFVAYEEHEAGAKGVHMCFAFAFVPNGGSDPLRLDPKHVKDIWWDPFGPQLGTMFHHVVEHARMAAGMVYP